MDIQLEKKPWYIRYRYYLLGGAAFAGLLVYVIILSLGPRRLRVPLEDIQICEVKNDKFLEYVDVEGLVQPILTILVNAGEAGSVQRIVAEEGSLLRKGDTILVLDNPELLRDIEDQRDEWEKQLFTYREKEIEMEQQRITLRKQALQTEYELESLRKTFRLDQEEYAMGVKSKAQLEVAEAEYRFKLETARLERESLRHDSAVNLIRRDLLRNDRERERKKYERARRRLDGLVVTAPADGQLSFVKVVPGQQVAAAENIAEVKVLDQYKIHTALSEYYIDRVTTGLPAAITYQGRRYPLRVSKVVPEVKDRTFDVDLVFTTDSLPDNVRVGKSFRVQIEADRTRARRVPLTIGRQNPQQYEVTDGLQPGDWVITTGYANFGEAEELVVVK